MKKVKTVAFHNLGCKVNAYEMEVMQQKFTGSGYEVVPFDSVADVYVINTCTVTAIADHKSRQMLHRAKKRNPESVVIAAGCYVQTDTEGALKDDAVDIIIGNNHKSEIVELLEQYIESHGNDKDGSTAPDRSSAAAGSLTPDGTGTLTEDNGPDDKLSALSDLTHAVPYEDCGISYSGERTRVDIKIQDGCDQFCSYCIIPYARGRVRSRSKESVVEEVKRLADKGFREVVLTGIHLSSYGIDPDQAFGDDSAHFPPSDMASDGTRLNLQGSYVSYNRLSSSGEYTNRALMDVIEAVSAVDGISRVRLGSLEPRVITREFLEFISSIDAVCPHFHLSLQSGCDATLKRMNRRYTTDEYYEKVELIREYYDLPAITTDIITGFPGETDEEFAQTVEFVKKVKFYETHVFKYSKRKGTVASTLPGQNTEAVKAARSDVLLDICARNREDFIRAHIGRECEILIEEEKILAGRPVFIGHTRDYIPAAVDVAVFDGELCKPKSGDIISLIGREPYEGRELLCDRS